MKIRYQGPKALPHRVQTPIPFVSRCEAVGVLEFNPDAEVDNEEWAKFLIEQCGEAFVPLETASPLSEGFHAEQTPDGKRYKWRDKETILNERYQKALGRRFSGKAGKWQATAYLKRMKLTDRLGMKSLRIGDKLVHWEIVPIAEADTAGVTYSVSDTSEGVERNDDDQHSDGSNDHEYSGVPGDGDQDSA